MKFLIINNNFETMSQYLLIRDLHMYVTYSAESQFHSNFFHF